MHISSLSTPCLLLEKKTLDANVRRMLARAEDTGVTIRPHLKTAKSAAVAELATASKRFGITVSTLLEADELAANARTDAIGPISQVEKRRESVLQANVQYVEDGNASRIASSLETCRPNIRN